MPSRQREPDKAVNSPAPAVTRKPTTDGHESDRAASAAGGRPVAAELLALQRLAGNRRVGRILATGAGPALAAASRSGRIPIQRSIADLEQAAGQSLPDIDPNYARRLMMQLAADAGSLAGYGPRRCLIHLLSQIASGSAVVTRAELDARSGRYARLITLRPDGYLVAALSGRPLQRAGGSLQLDAAGSVRSGGYEVGRFYHSNGGVFYNVDESLNQTGPPIGELGLEHDLPNRVLDGVEDAVVGMVHGIAALITHPIKTIEGLAQLPGVVRQLIANAPEYWERFTAMPLGDQVQRLSELVTTLTLLYGTAAGTTTRLSAAAADLSDVTINVLRLQANGSFAVAQVTVPVGTVATALSGGPAAVYVLAMANQASGGGGSSGGGGGGGGGPRLTKDPGVTLTASEEAAAQHWVGQGNDVRALRPAGSSGVQGVRTADLEVNGVGRVDVYSPEPTTNANNLVRAILDKNSQTAIVHMEIASTSVTEAELLRIPNRVFGHPRAGGNITRIVVRLGGRVVVDAVRR